MSDTATATVEAPKTTVAPAANTVPATADKPVERTTTTPPRRESFKETMARATDRRPRDEPAKADSQPDREKAKPALEEAPVKPKGESLPPAPPVENGRTLSPAERRAKLEALATKTEVKADAPATTQGNPLEVMNKFAATKDDPPSFHERVKGLQGVIKTVAGEKEQVAAELKAAREELEQLRGQTAELPPEQKAEVEQLKKELVQYRRRYDLEKDPEFNAKFTAKIKDADEVIGAITKRLPEWIQKAIADEKGLVNLARSPRTFNLQKGDETEAVDGNGLYQRILAFIPKVDADRLGLAVARQDELTVERSRAIEAATAEADKYFAGVEKTQGESQRVQAERRKVIRGGLTKFRDAAWQKPDFKDVEVGDSADPSLKEAAKAQNEVRSEMRQLLGDYIGDDILTEVMNEALLKIEADPKLEGRAKERAAKEVLEGWGQLIVHSVERHGLAFEVKQRDQRIAALEKEITDLKDGSRTTLRTGSAEHVPDETRTAPTWVPGQKITPLSSLLEQRRQ